MIAMCKYCKSMRIKKVTLKTGRVKYVCAHCGYEYKRHKPYTPVWEHNWAEVTMDKMMGD